MNQSISNLCWITQKNTLNSQLGGIKAMLEYADDLLSETWDEAHLPKATQCEFLTLGVELARAGRIIQEQMLSLRRRAFHQTEDPYAITPDPDLSPRRAV